MKYAGIGVALAALMVGCGGATPEAQTGGVVTSTSSSIVGRKFGQFDPVDVSAAVTAPTSDVRIVDGEDVGCETEAIAVVDANDRDRARAIETMRTRAGALGAEALVSIANEGTHYTATAVKCHNLLAERAYEVIETITIAVVGNDDAGAFDTLKAQAYELKADLIIDIDRQPNRITGTAIRYK